MQESKYVFIFSDFNDTENKSACKYVGNVFLMIKIGPGVNGFTCLFSHNIVVVLSAKRMTKTLT
jgi:hypothetical protein